MSDIAEWLTLAEKRIEVPANWVRIKYLKETDLLSIRVIDSPSTHSESELTDGVIYNYDAENRLVGIEILDLYGIYDED